MCLNSMKTVRVNQFGVRDIYNHEGQYRNWKTEVQENGIVGLSQKNVDLILRFITDMEEGRNIAKGSPKGGRSFVRLNNLRIRMIFLSRLLEKKEIKDLSKCESDDALSVFNDMRSGKVKKRDGTIYESVADYVKTFATFWHWLQKVSRKEGKELPDITDEFDTRREENSFVYFTFKELQELLPYFSENEQVRMLFMFDTIIRSPSELMNVKVSDLTDDCKELSIRDETSKTYGRRIKVLLCSEELKRYIERNNVSQDDFLFSFPCQPFNETLRAAAAKAFGGSLTKGGKRYGELTMYDFRHSGACHWRLGAYRQKIDALMYRGGWNDLTTLNYYTKKLGMKDSIEKEDLLVGVDKTELEKEIEDLKNDGLLQKEKIQGLSAESRKIWELLDKVNAINTVLLQALAKNRKAGKGLSQLPSQKR